jgi:hypothetical protein
MKACWIKWRWPLAILLGAFAIRLVFFTGLQGNDDLYYSAAAYRLSRGDFSLRPDLFLVRVGYVGPAAVLYALFGVHIGCLVAMNVIASMTLVFLAFKWGEELYSTATGRVAALAVALMPLDVFFATEAHSDLPVTAWVSLGFYLFWSALRAPPSRTVWRAIAAGLAFGVAHLTKESAFLLLLPVIPFALTPGRRRLAAVSAAAFSAVILAESAAYGVGTGDPLFRVHLAKVAQSSLPEIPGGFGGRLLELLSFCLNPAGPGAAYTGAGWLLSAAGLAWVMRRDRKRSGWIAAWWLGTGVLLALWPLALIPYRPAMLLQPRVFAPLVLPGALLAARFFVEAALPRSPRIAWGGAAAFALLALACTFRLHEDGVRWRIGAEWAHRQLAARTGATVLTDLRTAEMLRMLNGYAPPFKLRAIEVTDPAPPAGTLLLDNERMVETSRRLDGREPPSWWRASLPMRERLGDLTIPPTLRLRRERGAEEHVVLSRIVLPP